MSIQSAWQLDLSYLGKVAVQIVPAEEHVSTDAGLLPIRQLDEQLGLTAGFAAQLTDARRGGHSLLSMTRQRVYGILAGYEDQNDHDQLRSDAVFKLLAGRRPDGDDLASQPTLSRFENSVTAGDLLRLEAWCLEQFVASFKQAPTRLTLDLDVYDDPTHGQQQFTFYHGFYEQYQYLVRVFTCAENDGIAFPVLLWGTAHASTGAADDLERVVLRLRQEWPCAVKTCVFQRVEVPPGKCRLPSSYRSDKGGNELVGAFETTGHLVTRRSSRP